MIIFFFKANTFTFKAKRRTELLAEFLCKFRFKFRDSEGGQMGKIIGHAGEYCLKTFGSALAESA